jgi:hypothetical protein
MTRRNILLGFAATLAVGGLMWLWLQPRTASDCAPSDSACLRRVAEHLISESLKTGSSPSISDEIDAAGRLLATEGTIDLSTQQDRLARIGFAPHGVHDRYFNALLDPAYPFDIPAALDSGTGPAGSDLEDYLIAFFRLSLRDPDRRADALALWDQHFDQLVDLHGSTGFSVLAWLALNDPARAAKDFQRAATARAFIIGPGGWKVFFHTAASHCRKGRLSEGRLLLDGLRTYLPPPSHTDLYPRALLDCNGEEAAVAEIEDSLQLWAAQADKVVKPDPTKTDFVASQLADLSEELRSDFADWLYRQGRQADVAAYWSRYGGAEIARRHLPQLDWLPALLQENQSAPAKDDPWGDLDSEPVEVWPDHWIKAGPENWPFDYTRGTLWLEIEKEWPSPQAIEALRALAQNSKGSARLTAFVVGLERQLGCAPSEARMAALLDEVSSIDGPLDEAFAIIDLLRFNPAQPAPDTPTDYPCLVE